MYVYHTVKRNFINLKTIVDAFHHYSKTPLTKKEIAERFFRMNEEADHAMIEKVRRNSDRLKKK